MVVLHGSKVSGRYVLFPTSEKNWMIHRMDPAPEDFTPLPKRVRPMLATAGTLPSDEGDWAYEIKWDGVRAIAFVDGGRIRLQSRNDKDLTSSFPEFRALGAAIGARPCVLDGEIVVLGPDGTPNFGLLQQRLHVVNANAIKKLAADTPASYVIFDLLHLEGRPLTALPYDERRQALEALNLSGSSFTTAESFHGVSGTDVLRATRENGLEGVIAKRRDSLYLEGRRSDTWIKVKNIRTQEVVIGGWTEGVGNRSGSLGALLLGVPSADGFRYVGKVGTGFSERDRDEILKLLRPAVRKKSPFVPPSDVREPKPPHYVRPGIVGEVQYVEWTAAGRLRHPSWRGLRVDKDMANVVVEE
jgi:bifunctional non-homologous end joining protein LigD